MPFELNEQDYSAWVVSPLLTPVSDVGSLALVHLHDNNRGLEIVVEAPRKPQRPRWSLTFSVYPAYRNVPEELRLALWRHLDATSQVSGHTFEVVNSPWLSAFRASEPLVDVHFPKLRHFVVTTEDDVIEVLSPEPPKVLELGPAPADALPAGKSEVFYSPEDGTAQDILFRGGRSDA
jgi:hypothetical protein